jgi:ATP-binding cassette, subfamily C, bacterial CydD
MNIDPGLLRQARHVKFSLVLTILLGVLGGVFTILWARTLSKIVADVFISHRQLSEVNRLIWLFLALVILRAFASLGGDLFAKKVAVRVKDHLRTTLFDHLLKLGISYSRNKQSGELIAVATEGIEALDAYFSQFLPQLALAAVLPAMILITIFPFDILTAIILLVTAPLIPVFMIMIGKASEALTHRQWTALSRMSAFFLDTIQGLVTLKTLNQSTSRVDEIKTVSESYRDTTMKVLRVTFLSALVLEMLATISTAVVAVEIGLRLLYNRIVFEQAFFILIIAPEFYMPLRMLGTRFHAGMAGVTAARKIFEIINENKNDVNETEEKSIKLDLSQPFTLTFQNVDFSYPGREQNTLRDVSFQIKSGQLTAFVGASGAGKSTTAHLLLRFFSPQRGDIFYNELPISKIPITLWRSQLSWVSQQPYLFSDTIAANISLGSSGVSESDVRQAAAMANLDEFFMSLPQRYQTLVGEGGIKLSGGQTRRLAIARAFLRNSPLLVMDEPTVYMDPEQETLLHSAIIQLCKSRTVVIIAHRLPTIRQADHIVVFDGGLVVESGVHSELIAAEGVYSRLIGHWCQV